MVGFTGRTFSLWFLYMAIPVAAIFVRTIMYRAKLRDFALSYYPIMDNLRFLFSPLFTERRKNLIKWNLSLFGILITLLSAFFLIH